MNFGQAIEALKQGEAVQRAGWNGKGMSVWLNKGIVDSNAPNSSHIDGVPAKLFEQGLEGVVTRLPNINMTSASGATVTGWLASQTDILAEDWQVVIAKQEAA
jgi:hypothetical protein